MWINRLGKFARHGMRAVGKGPGCFGFRRANLMVRPFDQFPLIWDATWSVQNNDRMVMRRISDATGSDHLRSTTSSVFSTTAKIRHVAGQGRIERF